MSTKNKLEDILSELLGPGTSKGKNDKPKITMPEIPNLPSMPNLGDVTGLNNINKELDGLKTVKSVVDSASEDLTMKAGGVVGIGTSIGSNINSSINNITNGISTSTSSIGGIPKNIGNLSDLIRKSVTEVPQELLDTLNTLSGKGGGILDQLAKINDINGIIGTGNPIGNILNKSGLDDIISGLKNYTGTFGSGGGTTSGNGSGGILRGSGENSADNQSLNQKPYYTILFTIDSLDLSSHVDSVKIISSIESVYSAIIIDFKIDSQDVILQKIYGQKPIKLTVSLRTEDQQELSMCEWNLIAIDIKTDFDMKPQEGDPTNQKTNPVTIVCVIKEAFVAMSTLVNRLIGDSKQMTPLEVVKDIVSKCAKIDAEIDEENKNTETIYQMIIPPMTLSKSIKYIDQYFGLYKGPYYAFCTTENGEFRFRMSDLSRSIKKPEEYTIYLLTAGGDQKSSVFDEVDPSENKYYVYDPMATKYKGNKSVMKEAYNHRFITRPMDKLYHNIDFNMNDVFKDNAAKSGSSTEMLLSEDVKSRYKIHTEHTGYETTDTFARSSLSQKLTNLSYLNFSIDRNINITAPMRVGIPIIVETDSPSYLEYRGKYLVSQSVIIITRASHQFYDCHVKNKCFRGDVLS
jgi:hypothetical protein